VYFYAHSCTHSHEGKDLLIFCVHSCSDGEKSRKDKDLCVAGRIPIPKSSPDRKVMAHVRPILVPKASPVMKVKKDICAQGLKRTRCTRSACSVCSSLSLDNFNPSANRRRDRTEQVPLAHLALSKTPGNVLRGPNVSKWVPCKISAQPCLVTKVNQGSTVCIRKDYGGLIRMFVTHSQCSEQPGSR